MENLRNVVFKLEQENMTIGDYATQEELEEKTKKREGFFHMFGNELIYDDKAECYLVRTIGIVEEEKTGKVFHVVPKFITFKS